MIKGTWEGPDVQIGGGEGRRGERERERLRPELPSGKESWGQEHTEPPQAAGALSGQMDRWAGERVGHRGNRPQAATSRAEPRPPLPQAKPAPGLCPFVSPCEGPHRC